MASPIAIRQPLAQRQINTAFYTSTNAATTATTANPTRTVILKPISGQKRAHSHISNGQENVQQQILSTATEFKSQIPRQPYTTTTQKRPSVNVKPIIQTQPQSQFKQPLSRPVAATPLQRQQTHDSGVEVREDREMVEWRKSMRRIISNSIFYLDGLEESFKEQATRWLTRHGGKVEQFFSNSVNIIVTLRDPPPQRPAETTKPLKSRNELSTKNLHLVGSRSHTDTTTVPEPVKDILIRAHELGIKVWSFSKFSRILRALSSLSTPVTQTQPQTINPLHLSAALQAEKRHGRTTETDPSVPREEYVYFTGPYILITDVANVHKPIMVREFPAGSDRNEALWPMFWAVKEGNCPFIRPTQRPIVEPRTAATPAPKHYARPNVLRENKHINRVVPEQPASGMINSSNAFSAFRSTTTCGSNITSALGGTTMNPSGSLPRNIRDLKTRLTPAVIDDSTTKASVGRMDPPASKKRKIRTTLREQLAKTTKEKEKRKGYCENCKELYENYDEHTQSRRHRKYARNYKNFIELDELLKDLERPLIESE